MRNNRSLITVSLALLLISLPGVRPVSVQIIGMGIGVAGTMLKWACTRYDSDHTRIVEKTVCVGGIALGTIVGTAMIVAGFFLPVKRALDDNFIETTGLFDDMLSRVRNTVGEVLPIHLIHYSPSAEHIRTLSAEHDNDLTGYGVQQLISFEVNGVAHTAVAAKPQNEFDLLKQTLDFYEKDWNGLQQILIGAGGQCDRCPKSCRDGSAFTPNCDGTPLGDPNPDQDGWYSMTHTWDNRDEAVKTARHQFSDNDRFQLGSFIQNSGADKICVGWHNVEDNEAEDHNAFRGELYPNQYGGLDNQCYHSDLVLLESD